MTQNMPTRHELSAKLDALRSGEESRASIAAWAMSIIEDGSLSITDQLAWKTLKKLGAVDLPAPDRQFLYDVADFEEWHAELNADSSR